MNNFLNISKSAASHIRKIMEDGAGKALRIGLKKGGCAGMEYTMEYVKLVVMHQQGSISLIQRRLKVGYSRAARLIDEMEQAGIVGAFTGSKAREVLVDESYLDSID